MLLTVLPALGRGAQKPLVGVSVLFGAQGLGRGGRTLAHNFATTSCNVV